METLLDPKLDYIFKKIFGTDEGKPQLISLLNALLKGQPHIQSLTLNNPKIDNIFGKALKYLQFNEVICKNNGILCSYFLKFKTVKYCL